MARLMDYFSLIRIPNIFTIPSNILLGYLLVHEIDEFSIINFIFLAFSSILLYVGGIVLNDYFDIKIDKIERPARPLASGRIPKFHALFIAICTFIVALILTSRVNIVSFLISILMIALIFGYDYKLKNTILNPFLMASVRVLNVLLGASTGLTLSTNTPTFILVLITTFVYIFGISFLSRHEVEESIPKFKMTTEIIILGFVIVSIIIFIILEFLYSYAILNLLIFLSILVFTLKGVTNINSKQILRIIKNLVLSIIVFDSIFISGISGITYGLIILLLLIPAILMSRKTYVT